MRRRSGPRCGPTPRRPVADGGADRTLAAFLRIPRPLFDLVFGREWYVDAGRPAGEGVAHDVFA